MKSKIMEVERVKNLDLKSAFLFIKAFDDRLQNLDIFELMKGGDVGLWLLSRNGKWQFAKFCLNLYS